MKIKTAIEVSTTKRQKGIEQELGCNFIRNDSDKEDF